MVSITPRPLYSRGKTGTHWIGGVVFPGLDDVERRKILPVPGHELWPLSRYTDYAIPALRKGLLEK
jgi:hypothetical protein